MAYPNANSATYDKIIASLNSELGDQFADAFLRALSQSVSGATWNAAIATAQGFQRSGKRA